MKMTRISIAPMVDVTDRHFRYFCRLLTKHSILYTEMITSSAIIHGDRNKLLDFNPIEKPLSLQIAGHDREEVKEAVRIAEAWDYDEINLNVGCPSDRVSGNHMGASLMAYPDLVAELVEAMREETEKPITVKHRIGIDGRNVLPDSLDKLVIDEYDDLKKFVEKIKRAGVNHFVIHARIAILEGLSPRQNREIPPTNYDMVYKIKEDFPELFVEINGGIKDIESIKTHLKHVDGVMLGRVAYENPFLLTKVDQFFDNNYINTTTRKDIILKLIDYVDSLEGNERTEHQALRNTLGLFHKKRGSKIWRQLLTPPWPKGYRASDVLKKALEEIPEEILIER